MEMKRLFTFLISAALCVSAIAQTPVSRGYSYVTLASAQSAGSTWTSSAVVLPNFSGAGVLSIVGSGTFTGSPSACGVNLFLQQNTGGTASGSIGVVAWTPGATFSSFIIAPSAALAAGDKIIAIYACTTYPTGGGTMTVTFNPIDVTADLSSGAAGAVPPSFASYVGGVSSGKLSGIVACDNSAAINMSTATTTQIIAISGTSGRTYICGIHLVVGAADNVALISGSGTNCASNQAGLAGGTSAASGWNFAANGGLSWGSGFGLLFKTATTNNEVCLVTSAAAQVSGTITYTQF
jgi:hypothetical protein